jgi:hypothetical protein
MGTPGCHEVEAIEGKLKAEPGHPNYDELDRESSRLCRILGY